MNLSHAAPNAYGSSGGGYRKQSFAPELLEAGKLGIANMSANHGYQHER